MSELATRQLLPMKSWTAMATPASSRPQLLTRPTTYQAGFFKEQPVKDYGAVPRLMVALARRRPLNGWAWSALAFGRFVWLEKYLPASVVCSEQAA